jgi:hypothetical protein
MLFAEELFEKIENIMINKGSYFNVYLYCPDFIISQTLKELLSRSKKIQLQNT